MTKSEAGRLGGLKTARKYGVTYMRELGSRGGYATWRKYVLAPVGTSEYAMVCRVTGKIVAIR